MVTVLILSTQRWDVGFTTCRFTAYNITHNLKLMIFKPFYPNYYMFLNIVLCFVLANLPLLATSLASLAVLKLTIYLNTHLALISCLSSH